MTGVVLVTVDSLRLDHVGCFGYERDTTPVIDRLAEDGLRFDGYANANWTRASFPSIITSTYPLEYGGFEYLSDNRVTIGEAASRGGVSTAAFHSNLWLSRDYNYDRGFDRFYDSATEPSLLARLRSALKHRLDHDSITYRVLQRLYDTAERSAGIDVGQTYKDAEVITDRAIQWLSEQSGPFFLWVHYMDVHHPYLPRDRQLDELGLDVAISDRQAVKLRRRMLETPEEITADEHQTLVDLYDGEIRYTDQHVGRLIDAASDAASGDVSVVMTSDHGEEFGEHGGYSHNPTMYDEVLEVPVVVSGPNLTPRSADEGRPIVELLDIAPTICDLLDVPRPAAYRGRSLLADSGRDDAPRVISENSQGADYKLSVRTDRWKYIWDRNVDTVELFDLAADSGEMSSVVAEQPEVAANCRSMLEEHLRELRATNEELPAVDMDSTTEDRLRDLGYL